MFAPQSKWWFELIGRDRQAPITPDELEDQAVTSMDSSDPQYLALKLKRKHMTNMLKQMLAQGGYQDLAKMTTLKRVSTDGADEDGSMERY